jgi:putative membrane protein
VTPLPLAADALRPDPWSWQPHPEIWALIAALAVLYWYAVTRLGPRAARDGETVVSGAQVGWFVVALATLWVASDWPVHDLAEEHLYAVHMLQHLLLSFAVPAMALLATPTWLARLVVGQGRAYAVVRRLARPVPATLIFNGVVVLTHWPAVVNASAGNGALHYGVHVLVVASALLMWLPVCGPLPELRFPLPVQMVYLFLQSVIPTVPAGWLTFADGAVYRSYDVTPRAFPSLSVAHDQQLAGMLMKIGGGIFLWSVIAVLFIRFASRGAEDDRDRGVPLDRRAPTTYSQRNVSAATLGPTTAQATRTAHARNGTSADGLSAPPSASVRAAAGSSRASASSPAGSSSRGKTMPPRSSSTR